MNARPYFFLLLLFGNATGAVAEDAKAPPPAATADAAAPLKKITVKIPSELRGSGAVLVINGEEYQLEQDSIEVLPSLDTALVELYGSDGRLLAFESVFMEAGALEGLRRRRFRVGVFAGSAHALPGPWRQAFLGGDWQQFATEFGYSFGAFGMRTAALWQAQSRNYAENFAASHTSTQLQLTLVSDLAPLRRFKGYLRKLQLSPLVGGFYAWHEAMIQDDEVKIKDSSANPGALFGAELRLPVMSNFAVLPRYFVSQQKIALPAVGIDTTVVQHNFIVGMAYAF